MILESLRIDIKPLSRTELDLYIKSREKFEQQFQLTPSGVILAKECCEELREVIDANPAAWDSKGSDYLLHTLWLLIERRSRAILGQFWFSGQPNRQGEVEIFFGIEKPHRGQGFATEAMQALLKWAREAQIFRVLTVGAYGDNAAAMASLRKLGFRRIENDDDTISSSKFYLVVPPREEYSDVSDFEV